MTTPRRLVVVESLTLDGVMQAPGRPDEDTRGGFEHGGWAVPYNDEVMAREMGKGMGTSDLLFGRWTYESFYAFWPNQTEPNPFTEVLNQTQKYVASTTLAEPLPWVNSTLLSGNAADAVAELKTQPGNDIAVLGSGRLVQSLIDRDLVDEYTLLIHPLVLGSGQRLFPEGTKPAELGLDHSVTTTTGVVIATFKPAR
ncbi:MAG TPA: dihydrofolate reductase family protein [Acidimicrobiia bacterium]|jgi:dihydrofolate reductase|nr:dihydrofolate reductase family protein [Acidimicrobiia bacterium]